MRAHHDVLRQLIFEIFARIGCEAAEADCVSRHLVQANLVGHDSHGVIRTPLYVKWVEEGKVFANRQGEVLF